MRLVFTCIFHGNKHLEQTEINHFFVTFFFDLGMELIITTTTMGMEVSKVLDIISPTTNLSM